MAGPLNLLQEYNVKKMKIIEQDGQIIFGEFSWPKNVETNYIVRGSSKIAPEKEYYTLECFWFLLNNIKLSHPVYVRKATAANIQVVRRPYRQEVLAYLNGEIKKSPWIDESVQLQLPNEKKIITDHSPETDQEN